MEVIKEVGILKKKHKASRPDGPSPSFLEDNGEVLTPGLTKPLRPIWTREEIRKDECEWVIALV